MVRLAKLHLSCVVGIFSVALAACGDSGGNGTDSGSDSGGAEIDEDAVIDEVLGLEQGGFVTVNRSPLESVHAAERVDIWAPPSATDLYFQIDPPNYSQPVTFPVGTTLIKRHFSDAGATAGDGFTVMHKGPAGYAPETGDWWWARLAEDGSIIVSGDGTGDTELCINCHNPASAADYVMGIDAADHNAP